jgi:rSAM/selenodomain-associated transferase 2
MHTEAVILTADEVDSIEAWKVSVIVPVLNEQARIGALLDRLAAMAGFHEVIVVDGGSDDGTVEIVRSRSAVRGVSAPKGRATQMNAGSGIATGDVLLFLHADVRLPDDAVRRVRESLADPEVVAGAFRTWTVADAGRSWLAPFLHLADLRSRVTSLPYGDQALFVRAATFRRIGGFPEIELMEDVELSRRLRRAGRIRRVRASVTVSGRRFLARPLYYPLLMTLFPLLFRLGVPPSRLARLYGEPR